MFMPKCSFRGRSKSPEQVAVIVRFVVEHLSRKRPGHPHRQEDALHAIELHFMVEI